MRKTILFNLFLFSAFIVLSQQPVNLSTTNINTTDVTLNWDNGGCTANYILRIRVDGAPSWQSGISIPNTGASEIYNLTGILSSTTYNWKIKCGGNWTNGPNFTTSSPCALTSSISITDAACNNTMNGSANLTVNNGSSPYSYLWSNGDTNQNLIDVLPGTYTVQISDGNGCTLSDTAIIGAIGTVSISQSLTDFSDTINYITNVVHGYHVWAFDTLNVTNTGCDVRIRPEFSISCSSGPIQQGDIVIKWQSPLGWNPNLDYVIDANGNANGYWSFTANDSTGTDITYGQIQDIVVQVKFVSPALYGEYTATWETFEVDAIGNKIGSLTNPNTVTLNLVDCSLFSISNIGSNNVSCNGGNDGNATITSITGGSGNYSYLWNNGNTNGSISNLSAGTYSVIVTDNDWGCTDSSSITISEPSMISASLSGTNITCNGSNNGTLNTLVNGGSGQFDVIWVSHPWLPPVPNQTNLAAGTYSIDVVDLICGDVTSTNYTITEPSIVTISSSYSDNTSCDTSICNGSISISLSGGTQPYIYSWTNGYTDSIRNDLCGGSYLINASDANGCGNFVENITLSNNASPASGQVTGSNISCFGLNDGSAEASIGNGNTSGGNISTLNYCLSAPGTNGYNTIDQVNLIGDGDAINNNTSGSCDTYEDYTSQYATLTPGSTYTINVQLGSCHGGGFFNPDSTGIFIDWNIDGDFDDPNEKIDVLYSNVSTTHNINITVPNIAYGPTRLRIVSQSQINNAGFPDGPVTACAVGDFGQNGTYSQPWYGATEDYSIVISGFVPATYLWNTGDTTKVISNLSSGTYYCQITDTNNCSITDTVTITEPLSITTTENITNVNCFGGNDGSASVSISGGTPGYTEDWGANNPNSLAAGTYNYTITDSNGCIFSDSIIITQPIAITSTEIITDVLCYGDTSGSIDITINGGTSPYTYSWNNGNTSEDLLNVSAGTYIITITDNNSCVYTDTLTINQPTSDITVSSTTTNASCNGYNDGSVVLTISGGTGQLSVDWLGYNPSSLYAGIYSYTITDSVGCSYTNNITINEPNPISIISTINNVSCFGLSDGNATLSIAGGTPGYTEDWGANNPNSLAAGTYNYTITDSNGCIFSDSVTIIQPQELNANFTQGNVSCFGGNDGSASVSISGGTVDYILSWDTFSYPLLGGINVFNTPIGVPAGIYPFGITDVNGCYFTDTIIITEPSQLVTSDSINNVSCSGLSDGNVTLTITGGTPGYTEDWGTNNPNSLAAGTYNYTITDSNGCYLMDSINITEPTTITTSIMITDLSSCVISNGSIDLSVSGGTMPYSFIWNSNDTTEDLDSLSAGNYYVTITDHNGCTVNDSATVTQPSNNLSLNLSTTNYNGFNISCNGGNDGGVFANTNGGTGSLTFHWSDMSTNSSLLNQSIGIYSVIVTDSIGCSLTDSVVLTEPSVLNSTYTTSNVLCYGDSTGSATVIFNGGVTDYLLSWEGYTYPLLNGINTFITPIGVPAGVYPYSVTDMNGCIHQDTITIIEPNPISSNVILSDYNGYNVSCNGSNDGSVTLNLNGGSGILTEDWLGYNPTSLYAGGYHYIITDSNNCTYTDSIVVTEPLSLTINISSINLSCHNSCDGEVSVQVSGGISPYNYLWNNGTSLDSITNVCSGNYNVIVTDTNGCTISDSSIVIQPTEIIINTDSIIEVSVYDGNDGEIYITASGGMNNYSYSWSGPNGFNSTNEDITGIYSGSYIITVTDSTNCSSTDSIYVDQPSSLTITLDTIINLLCFEECNGQIMITADGGDSVYTYLWTGPNGFNSTDEDLDSLCAGTYELTLSDSSNSVFASFTITQPSQLQIITNADTALCYGGLTQATAYSYGGQYPYTTTWDVGSSSISTNLNAGIHYVNVIDANGCSATDSILIIQNDSMSTITMPTDISCFGLTDGSVQIDVQSGGLSPFEYSDDNGQTFQGSNIFMGLSSGNSTYIIRDANGCTISASATITEPNELVVQLDADSASCYGECDGTAIITISGGMGSYTEDWGGLDPNNLCAGLVNVIVQDSNNCLATNSVIITEPNPVVVIISANGMALEATSGFVSYQWIDENGANILGATSQSFNPTSEGEYSVEVMDQNGCIGISNSVSYIIESIEDNNRILSVYPNPATDWIIIESKENINNDLNIINIFGELVYTISSDKLSDNHEKINMSELSRGVYIIQLINNNTIINHRIIVQ